MVLGADLNVDPTNWRWVHCLTIPLNDLCSELAAQKEKGHLTHSIFNFDNPVDIHLSNPGDNAELDPTTKNGNKQSISKANSPAEKLWWLLGYHWLRV